MIIEEKDFKLTPLDDSSTMFDLELLYTIKPKNKETREEFKVAAYGLPLIDALEKIVQYRISKNHPDTISLKEYITEFKTQLKQLKDLYE